MTLPAWDLDAPVDPPRVHPGFRIGPVLLLGVGLAGLGLGGLIGSALAPPATPRFPATATLTVRDLYVTTSAAPSSPPSSPPSAAPSTGPSTGAATRIGNPVVVVRLRVDNPAAGSIQVTALVLDGVARASSTVLPLSLRVAGHSSASSDLTLHPDCSAGREPIGLRAWLRLTGPAGSGPATVRIAPARSLVRDDGLCSEVNTELPSGWRTPLQANGTRLTGLDLEVTIDDLSAARLAGILVDNQLLPTVFVGDQLLNTTARLRTGEVTHLRLRGPPPCVQSSGSTPIPSTLRLLAEGEEGMQQRLVVVGPMLTRWLRLGCAG